MKFAIVSRDELTGRMQPCLPFVLIRIMVPGDKAPTLPKWDNCLQQLKLQFHDLTPRVFRRESGAKYVGGLITDAQADEIIAFALRWHHKAKLMIISCDGGISRSPAVAAALSVVLDGEGMDRWVFEATRYQPNMFVYAKITKRWRIGRIFGDYQLRLKGNVHEAHEEARRPSWGKKR